MIFLSFIYKAYVKKIFVFHKLDSNKVLEIFTQMVVYGLLFSTYLVVLGILVKMNKSDIPVGRRISKDC